MENAYLSALADEAKAGTEAPLSTAELVEATVTTRAAPLVSLLKGCPACGR